MKLEFPPSAMNLPKETLKVKVTTTQFSFEEICKQWLVWLLDERQTSYNRVEFKYRNVYVVIAKLKNSEEE